MSNGTMQEVVKQAMNVIAKHISKEVPDEDVRGAILSSLVMVEAYIADLERLNKAMIAKEQAMQELVDIREQQVKSLEELTTVLKGRLGL